MSLGRMGPVGLCCRGELASWRSPRPPLALALERARRVLCEVELLAIPPPAADGWQQGLVHPLMAVIGASLGLDPLESVLGSSEHIVLEELGLQPL